MAERIGLQVVERTTRVTPAIVPAPFGNIGVLVESQRGPVNKAISVTSIAEYATKYGEPRWYDTASQHGTGYFVMRALFNNAATFGAQTYVVRVDGAASGTTAVTAAVTAGDTKFQALVTGTDGNDYQITIEAGTATGRKITLEDDPAAPTVTEVYDNVPDTVAMADGINRGIDTAGMTYDLNGGGADSNIIASTLAKVLWCGGTLPDNLAKTAFTGGATGVYATAMAPVAAAVNPVFGAGQLGDEDPGTWGNQLRITFTTVAGAEWLRDVSISRQFNGVTTEVETWTQVSETTFESLLNDADAGSEYTRVTTSGALPNGELGAKAYTTGTDPTAGTNTEYAGTSAGGTGVYAFDQVPVNMITSGDLQGDDIAKTLGDYAEFVGNVTAVASTTQSTSIASLSTGWTPKLLKAKSFLSVVRGWVKVNDELGGKIDIPNTGHVLGAGYIRKMNEKGGLPHIAPAGVSTGLLDALDIEFRDYNAADLATLVREVGINPIMNVSGFGSIVRTSRTFSSLSDWYSVHVRRSLNFIKDSFANSLMWVEQEPNSEDTRARVRQVLLAFLTDLYNRGMFETSGGFENNVRVKCDSENNPINVVNQRKLIVDVVLRFVEVAQDIIVNVEATRSGIITTEL